MSLYEIPEGCICMGDGLMGMKCDAPTHAKLLSAHAVKDQPVETEEKSLVVSQKLKKESE